MKYFIKKVIFTLFLVISLAFPAYANEYNWNSKNNYPIILVHGFLGWGRDEVLGFKYWGGFNDIQEDIRDKGYEVYTATVGPISSNWDRACELYAYIKGGRVDYGKAHSKKYGHARFGRTYSGLYRKWNNKNKIHLIGHSMGGQTIRTLVQLLEKGSMEEVNNTDKNDISPLFLGDKHWTCSVTTISTPHDGSSIADKGNYFVDKYAQRAVCDLAAMSGSVNNFVYDFKVDQWGLKMNNNESYLKYANKVWNSSIWNSKDISKWDLSPQGAKELNSWVKAQPNVYYFSWTTKATKRVPIIGNVVPDPIYMNPVLVPTGTLICNYTHNDNKGINIDSKWFQNDGAVSVISANGPKLGSKDKIVEYSPNKLPKKGQWTHMGILNNTDHMDIVGIGNLRNLTKFYVDIAKNVTTLPE